MAKEEPRSLQVPPVIPVILIATFCIWLQQQDLIGTHPKRSVDSPDTAAAAPGRIYSMAFSPDGQVLATGGKSRSIDLRDATSGKLLRSLKAHTRTVNSVQFSPDGRWLASGGEVVRLWDWKSEKEPRVLEAGPERTRVLRFSSDGRRIGSRGDYLRTWDVETGKLIHDHPVTDIWDEEALSPNLRHAATHNTVAVNWGIRIWDMKTGKIARKLSCFGWSVNDLKFSPVEPLFAAVPLRHLMVWDLDSEAEPVEFKGHDNRIECLAFTPDGSRILTAGYDATIRIWDIKARKQVGQIATGLDFVMIMAVSPDGTRVAGANIDGRLRFWPLETGISRSR